MADSDPPLSCDGLEGPAPRPSDATHI